MNLSWLISPCATMRDWAVSCDPQKDILPQCRSSAGLLDTLGRFAEPTECASSSGHT